MRLAMSLPSKKKDTAAQDHDPREGMSAEIIDLASRTAYPGVSQRKGKSDALGLAGGIGIVALLGLATLWGMNSARNAPPEGAAPAPQQAPPPAAQQPVPTEVVTEVPAPQQNPAPSPVLSAQPQSVMAMNPNASPTLVFDAGGLPIAMVPPGADGAPGTSAGDFASRVGGVGGAAATAMRNFDPQTTVTQGTLIPAVLETAINTDVPGFVRAIVSQDVRSYDGRRILVPRSSRLIGQYQSGLQAGQKRAYVIWTRLIRPDGVSVALASPGTDYSGQTGLPGDVNNHFFKRFGSAMLLSVIGGVTGALSGGAGAVILGGTQSAAGNAVNQTGNIAPTVRVRQGEPIRVFTARDLDFSSAPQL